MGNEHQVNGVGADYASNADTLLEVWRASRERVQTALEAKRRVLVAQLAEVDKQLAEVCSGGTALSVSQSQAPTVGTHLVKGEVTAKQLNFLRQHPGSTIRQIAEGTGVDTNSTQVRFALLREKRRVYSVPRDGRLRWTLTGT